jgi:purine-nucleoside phosphorylase
LTSQSAAAIVAMADRGISTLPPLGLVLGSGLGGLADEAEDAVVVPYADIPGFPIPSVAGHSGRLVVGKLAGKRVALFQGRGHYYERGDPREMFTAIEAFSRLGGRTLFLTNAAGGLHADWPPPALAAIVDHINFAGANPLIGLSTDKRFVPLTEAYDRALLATLKQAARAAAIELREGVYMWFSGPSFETPAEIRAAKILGADLVGMSTVPEVLIARYFGLRVVACSLVTNFAAGLSGGDPSHEETQAVAARGSRQFRALLKAFIALHDQTIG